MATKSKEICGVVFEITAPYEAGHTLTEAEAKALNQVRSENIGNNVRAKVKELIEAGDEAGAKTLVAEKDASYIFTVANVAASAKYTPEEKEARNMAKDILRAKLADKGLKLTAAEGVDKDEWDAKVEGWIAQIASNETIVKAAKKAVAERANRAANIAADLDLG